MTRDVSHLVSYALIRGDPRLDQEYRYPLLWVPSIARAMQQVAPSVQQRADIEIRQAVGPAVDEAFIAIFFEDPKRMFPR